MKKTVSKAEFKPKALELLRMVQNGGGELIITDRGKPVLKIIPYQASEETSDLILSSLRGSVESYENPCEPVGEGDWERLKK